MFMQFYVFMNIIEEVFFYLEVVYSQFSMRIISKLLCRGTIT